MTDEEASTVIATRLRLGEFVHWWAEPLGSGGVSVHLYMNDDASYVCGHFATRAWPFLEWANTQAVGVHSDGMEFGRRPMLEIIDLPKVVCGICAQRHLFLEQQGE